MSATPKERLPEAASATAPMAMLRRHLVGNLRLAVPVVVARAGLLVMATVDIAMTGRAGVEPLAHLGLGMSPQLALMVVGIGILQGTAILSAQAAGAGQLALCGRIWRVGLAHGVALGVLFGVLCLFGEAFLLAVGQQPDLAAGGGGVLRMFAWSMPPLFAYIATAAFMEGIGRPRAAMVAMLVAIVLNAGLNSLFIDGGAGLPALGAEGAALATSLSRWVLAAVLVGYVLVMPGGAGYGVRGPLPDFAVLGRRLRRLGYPLGLAQGLETFAFMTVMLFAGWLGAAALGGFQIAINVISMVFMCAIGIASATAVRVGHSVGGGDRIGVAYAGWSGVALVLVLMAGFAAALGFGSEAAVALYSAEPAVIAAGVSALSFGALFLMFDGSQAVLMGALRGTGDVMVPLAVQGAAFWLLAVPAAWVLAFRLDLGTAGVLGGLFLGVVASSAALALRFAAVSRRAPRRA